MTILAWNCQGLGQCLAVQTLHGLIKKYCPFLVFLSETKQQEVKLEKLRLKWGFKEGIYVDPVGNSGGLACWWTDNCQVQTLFTSKNFIDLLVTFRGTWHFTGVYGAPNYSARDEVWSQLKNLHLGSHIPWLCLGDFNAMLTPTDKQGRNPVNWAQLFDFNNLLSELELLDLEFKGHRYTWTNRQLGGNRIWERIDLGLANINWREKFQYAQVFHESLIGSDHRPLIVELNCRSKRRKSLFKLQNRWLEEQDCYNVVCQAWANSNGSGNSLSHKLQRCRKELIHWSKKHYGNSGKQIASLKKQIDAIHAQNIVTEDMAAQEKSLLLSLEDCYKREEMFWHQKSRVNWLRYGDRNTKFFHLSTIVRRQRNQLAKIKNCNGAWIEDEEAIRDHALQFFQKLYSKESTRVSQKVHDVLLPLINNSDNLALGADVHDSEIDRAVFQLGALKAPGPDGFPGCFYHKYWPIIKTDVYKMVHNFFRTEHMPRDINFTYISLIPKTSSPESISDYRPISCCNFSYKIISKILANRLKPILKYYITQEQAAFVSGRCIFDNIIVNHEAIHNLKLRKKGKKGYFALKIDMLKAFDRLDWGFIHLVLSRTGFHSRWIRWVMKCIRSVTFAVIVNGQPSSTFSPTRGIRQGDPLSPYIFIIVSDVLSRLIHKEREIGNLEGYRITPRCPAISHLLFADDTVLYGRAAVREAHNLKTTLNHYSNASGQSINLHKSDLYLSPNTDVILKGRIASILGIAEVSSFGKYLGVPSSWGRSKIQACQYLLDKALKQLQSWKSRLLNQAGREIMIKSILQALPTFLMSVFILPKSVITKLESLTAKFWWNVDYSHKSIHWRSWNKMTKPKSDGGLGFKQLSEFNKSLVAKQSWKLLQDHTSLWAKVLRGIYFPHTNFLEAKRGGHPSWAWTSILAGRELITKGAHWTIGNGESIDIWESKWLPDSEDFRLQHPTVRPHGVNKVADLMNKQERTWNFHTIHKTFTPKESQQILSLPLGLLNKEDSIIWHYTKSGTYTVKSGYKLLNMQQHHTANAKLWNSIWNLKGPPKIRNFIWRCASNALAVQSNLFRRNLSSSNLCRICQASEEDIMHMLIHCHFSRLTWFSSTLGFNTHHMHFSSFCDWWIYMIDSLSAAGSKDKILLVANLCWRIWCARNSFIFQQKAIFPRLSANEAWKDYCLQIDCRPQTHLHNLSVRARRKWLLPPPGKLKLNSDASFDSERNICTAAFVCRDHQGNLIFGKATKYFCRSALSAEALALRDAVRCAILFNWHQVDCEADSSVLIDYCNQNNEDVPWDVKPVIDEITSLAKKLTSCSFNHVYREQNQVADWVSKEPNILYNEGWFTNPPAKLQTLLYGDLS